MHGCDLDGVIIACAHVLSSASLTSLHAHLLASPPSALLVSGPGWCRTDMAGSSAPRTAEEGARTFSHLALLPTDQTPNGQFWEDCKVSSITR